MEEHGDAGHSAELGLDLGQLVAVADVGDRVELDAVVGGGVGRRHDDPADALDASQRVNVGHVEPALGVLATGHGHGVVEQQLVGDVDLGRDGGPDGE